MTTFRPLRALAAALVLMTGGIATAADFFDTSTPSVPFRLGARIGVNTSNRTIDKNVFDRWNDNAWGTGFDLGVVADINIRDFIALQPGFFFESRSGNHTYVNTIPQASSKAWREQSMNVEMVQYGHDRSYAFNIPVLCSVRFNISDDVRWSVDLGPYFAFILKNDIDQTMYFPGGSMTDMTQVKPRNIDIGLKIGSGLNILDHYYVGIHYLAGGTNPWKEKQLGGCNKAWTFTLGYDL